MNAAVSSLEVPPPAVHRSGDLVLPYSADLGRVFRRAWAAVARRRRPAGAAAPVKAAADRR